MAAVLSIHSLARHQSRLVSAPLCPDLCSAPEHTLSNEGRKDLRDFLLVKFVAVSLSETPPQIRKEVMAVLNYSAGSKDVSVELAGRRWFVFVSDVSRQCLSV